jgi:serine/threonine-protein kinase
MDLPLRERGCFAFGRFELDPVRRTLLHDGRPVAVTARVFDVLLYFVRNPDRLLERDELEQTIWPGRQVEEGNLQKAVAGVRKALQQHDPAGLYVVTVPGRGFRFAQAVGFVPEAADTLAPDRQQAATATEGPPRPWHRGQALAAFGLVVCVAGLAGALWHGLPRRQATAPFAPPPHSIAVLAFANMTGDASTTYFSDGLADELINTLSRVEALRVAARTSAFTFKDSKAAIGDIARQLNVGTVLEGSVRGDGAHLHIDVQLVDARTGFPSWSHSFSRDRFHDDMLTVQTDIAEAVAPLLEVKLLGGAATRIEQGGTHNARAFDAYLRGENNVEATDETKARQAVTDFTEAISLDPTFAEAFAGRATAHYLLRALATGTDMQRDAQYRLSAEQDAEHAVALAPALADGHRVRALLFLAALDFNGWREEIDKARDLAPGDTRVETTYGVSAAKLGFAELGLAALRHAITLDPLNPSAYRKYGEALYWSRHYDEALAAYGRADALDPHPSRQKQYEIAVAYLHKGDPARAVKICVGGDGLTDHECLAFAYHAVGRQADAEAQLATLQRLVGDRGTTIYAWVCAFWGRKADAIHWLRQSYAKKSNALVSMRVEPAFDPIRDMPEFQEIEAKMNFPPITGEP